MNSRLLILILCAFAPLCESLAAPKWAVMIDTNNATTQRVVFATAAPPKIGTNQIATMADLPTAAALGALTYDTNDMSVVQSNLVFHGSLKKGTNEVATLADLSGLGGGSTNLPVAVTTLTSGLLHIVTSGGTNVQINIDESVATNGQWNGAVAAVVGSTTNFETRTNAAASYVSQHGTPEQGLYTSGQWFFIATNAANPSVISFIDVTPSEITTFITDGGSAGGFTISTAGISFMGPMTGIGSGLESLRAESLIAGGKLPALDASSLSNVGSYATSQSLSNYLRIVSAPTNYTAYGQLNWVAADATNAYFYTGTRWRKLAWDTTGGW